MTPHKYQFAGSAQQVCFWRGIAALAIGIITGAMLMGLHRQNDPPHLRARSMEIVNEDGIVVFRVGCGPVGTGQCEIMDRNGVKRAAIEVMSVGERDLPVIRLWNVEEGIAASLSCDQDGYGSLSLKGGTDRQSHSEIMAITHRDGSHIILDNADRKPLVKLKAEDAAGAISTLNTNGQTTGTLP